MDRKILRNRLKYRVNPEFLKWVKSRYPALDRDHILGSRMGKKGRLNDLLIAPKPHEKHMKDHTTGRDFDEDLIIALELVLDYVEYLQGKNLTRAEMIELISLYTKKLNTDYRVANTEIIHVGELTVINPFGTIKEEVNACMELSESSLKKDWDNETEDKTWKNL